MKKYLNKYAVGALAGIASMSFAFSSCELDMLPPNNFTTESFWKTQTEFEGFIYAQENMFRANYPANILFYAGELRAGLLTLTCPDGSGVLNIDYIQNLYDADHCQFSTFGGYYGFIGNLNELIYRCKNQSEGIIDESTRDGLMAIAYGWRAYCYFQMYRMYGGVPLRLEPDVILGETDPVKLRMPRATAVETMAQIKADINESLRLFNSTSYKFGGGVDPQYTWSKAATEMLAGQVYLWNGKVTVGSQKATPGDVAIAKTYFENVIKNYGYSLESNFYDIWTNKANKEAIFSICYTSESDGVYYTYPSYYFLWARLTGSAKGLYWSNLTDNAWETLPDDSQTVVRFGNYFDELTQQPKELTMWPNTNFGPMRYCYKNALYYQFDEEDSRRQAFMPVWYPKDPQDDGLTMRTNFDRKSYDMAGTFTCKFRPKRIASSDYLQFLNDMPIYRLADAYLGLAECCNYAGDNPGVEENINKLRQRAYGANWDINTYGYKAGSFAENEVALLQESDKEFYMEGHRWWDLRRLTLVKDGGQLDHLVFKPEGCVGYGLDPVANPWMKEVDRAAISIATPVLTADQEYRLLWPVDATLMASDDQILQNPGYADNRVFDDK